MMRPGKRRGSAIVEFALTGIPMIFVWISIVQMAIGMWRYHTLQYAVKQAGSFIAVHGTGCRTVPNNCGIEIQDAATILHNASPGLPPSMVSVTFKALQPDHVTASGTTVSCTLDNCLTNTTPWPPSGYRDHGYDITIQASFTFRSALSMYAPGSGAVGFGQYTLPAYTHQMILF